MTSTKSYDSPEVVVSDQTLPRFVDQFDGREGDDQGKQYYTCDSGNNSGIRLGPLHCVRLSGRSDTVCKDSHGLKLKWV
jgi:hypothetical protein